MVNESTKVQTLSANRYASVVSSMHKMMCIAALESVELNECADSLQVVKVSVCWQE